MLRRANETLVTAGGWWDAQEGIDYDLEHLTRVWRLAH
jgi:hypothetical protein